MICDLKPLPLLVLSRNFGCQFKTGCGSLSLPPLSCPPSIGSVARSFIWLSWKSSSMTPHFPGCHRANVDCLLPLSCAGRKAGDGQGCGRRVPLIYRYQPGKGRSERGRERENPLLYPPTPAPHPLFFHTSPPLG